MDSCEQRIAQIATDGANLPGPLLPILHQVQEHFGYLPPATVHVVAEVLNLSRAEVHGVISFYHLFQLKPPALKTIFLCRAEACQSMGGEGLAQYTRARLGIDWHQTTGDGRFALEPIYCLGNCACAPAMMVDDKLIGRADRAGIDALIDG